jgi:hypothetical protein
VSLIDAPSVIERILHHLKLWDRPERAPPTPAPRTLHYDLEIPACGDDLKFSGFFTIPSKSFYPPQPIVRPEDINYDAWGVLPFKLGFLAAGTLEVDGGILRAELRIIDMKQRSMSFGQRISGDSDQVRSIAHRWADEVVYKLTAGASLPGPGRSSTNPKTRNRLATSRYLKPDRRPISEY